MVGLLEDRLQWESIKIKKLKKKDTTFQKALVVGRESMDCDSYIWEGGKRQRQNQVLEGEDRVQVERLQ